MAQYKFSCFYSLSHQSLCTTRSNHQNDKPHDGRPLHNEVFEAMERMYDFSVEYVTYEGVLADSSAHVIIYGSCLLP